MARSYPSRRFPAGPYLEPTVSPALRGPKRTGPIGAIVPGDDVEVARELARQRKGPKKEPVVVHVKLSQDGADGQPPLAGDGLFYIGISEDQQLMSLVHAELYVSTESSTGDVEVMLRKVHAQQFDDNGVLLPAEDDVDLLVAEFPLIIEQGKKKSRDSATQYEIDLRYAQVEVGDEVAVDLDVTQDDIRGLGIILTFK